MSRSQPSNNLQKAFNTLKSLSAKVLYFAPLALISLVAAAVPYIGISTSVQILFKQPFESLVLYLGLACIFWLAGKAVIEKIWVTKDFSLRSTHILFLLAFSIIAYRSVIYFHAIDDFAFHLAGGYFAGHMWLSGLLLPMDISTYLFPMLQTVYYFFVQSVGIRFSMLILSSLQLLWLLHLNLRFSAIIFPRDKHKRYWVDLFFVFLFFLPELVSTHVTFMSDFYSVLFALEALYAFLKKSRFSWLVLLMTIAAFCKQSSGIFLIPLFVTMAAFRLKTITKQDFLIVGIWLLPVGLFHVVSYLFTGNPTSFLLNSVFQSSLYPLDNFRDRRWGPQTLIQILTWPLYGPLSPRFVEPIAIVKSQAFFSLFTVLPFLTSLFIGLKKRKVIFMIVALSYFFWSFYSGYGRYAVAFGAMSWMLVLKEMGIVLPTLKNTWKITVMSGVLAFICLSTFRADYALRGFLLERFFPPKVSPYNVQLFLDGFSFFGRDRYQDVYAAVQHNFKDYGMVANGYRGIVTYYSMLAHMFENKPVISAVSPEQHDNILSDTKLDASLRNNLRAIDQQLPILLVADGGHIDAAYKSKIFRDYTCIQLDRPRLAPQFQHDNFFNHIVEFSCQ